MGDITDLIKSGILCQVCGTLMTDLIPERGHILKDAPGYPRTCKDCLKKEED